MSATRLKEVDLLKGVAIFLVVWGHCIQFLTSDRYDFFGNYIFTAIYSFHMPLFMGISGYLFGLSLGKKNLPDAIMSKLYQLIVPVISWSIMLGLILNGSVTTADISYQLIFGLWFIGTLCVISIIFLVSHPLSVNYFLPSTVAICLLLLLLPDDNNMKMIKYLAPYFAFGMMLPRIKHYACSIGVTAIALTFMSWVLLIIFWSKSYYIYITGMTLPKGGEWQQAFNNIYRYAGGFAGCAVVMMAARILIKAKHLTAIFSFIGRHTLVIYNSDVFVFLGQQKQSHRSGAE
ncbi:TPA: acyltransferase [Escherichia coli]|uniref:acyltransferase family protein n=2 Tax=Escherichia coli TaxID=562 RepID=UPI000460E520|nr:acyltransferase [Escherichia coli]EER0913097.1 acyltransferase [Escherichia coli O168:H8]EES8552678.1 acyltransferase [Escherichia coli O168]EKE4532892.1 acyltransferase [Escherichia coli O157]EKE4540809.1 acyltransferase [Escherichia coli O103]EKM2494443.1 acyltransferase [Escherichia coli O26]